MYATILHTIINVVIYNNLSASKGTIEMQEDLISILKKRLAKGEISIGEYNELSSILANDIRQKASTPTINESSFQDKPVILIDEKNWFGNATFAHQGNIHHIEEIIALRSRQQTQTLNFAPSHLAGFDLTLNVGSVLNYFAMSIFVKTNKVNILNEAYDFIRKITFTQRVNQYLRQIEDKGSFQYHDYFIYGNGEIKHKNKMVNIAESALQNNVEFGRKSSVNLSSYYTPDEIWIFNKIPGKFFKQHILIKTKENRDVIYAILIKLAELKGGKVTFIKP